MYKRTTDRSRFDAVALVELTAKQLPDGGAPLIQAKLCYIDSKTGTTFGYIDLVHNQMMGLEVLGPEVLAAWAKFCEEVEKQQGQMLFGEGKVAQLELGLSESAETEEGINVGLGGGV